MEVGAIATAITGILIPIGTILYKMKKGIKEENEKYTDLKTEEVKDEVKDLSKIIKSNERDRLRYIINKFANKLRKGEEFNRTSFRSAFDDYEKYKSLGGNGFITEEMEYIKRQYHKKHKN